MTEKQIKEKVQEMYNSIDIQWYVDKVLQSGCVNIDSWEDNDRLPKIILATALKQMAFQYEPMDATDKNTVSNIILLL